MLLLIGTVELWELQPDETWTCKQSLIGHTGSVRSARFNKAENKILTVSDDCTVKVWALQDGTWVCRHTLSGHKAGVYSAIFDKAEGKILSASDDGTVRLWDIGKFNDLMVHLEDTITPPQAELLCALCDKRLAKNGIFNFSECDERWKECCQTLPQKIKDFFGRRITYRSPKPSRLHKVGAKDVDRRTYCRKPNTQRDSYRHLPGQGRMVGPCIEVGPIGSIHPSLNIDDA